MTKRFEIQKEVALRATPEQVWQAIATSAGLATWFQPAEIDANTPQLWQRCSSGKRSSQLGHS